MLTWQINMKQKTQKTSLLSSCLSFFALFSGLVKVGVCHFSNVKKEKKAVLKAFKKTVSGSYREFKDNDQKVNEPFLFTTHSILPS